MLELTLNAILSGILIAGYYCAITLGLTIAFGMLDIANLAHPAFVALGGYAAYLCNKQFGIDPILAGLLTAPIFYFLGILLYKAYYFSFAKRGTESLRAIVFFFAVILLIEVGLIMTFGVDLQLVRPGWQARVFNIGFVGIPMRYLVPFLVGIAMTGLLFLFFNRTFFGRMIRAVAQDSIAVSLMGAKPERIRTVAFGIAIASAGMAGSLLITIIPVEPSLGVQFIGRVFAITVLGGVGSIVGTLVAAVIVGVSETMTATFVGPSWTLGVSFGLLLIVLIVKPSGLFRR